MKEIAIKLIEFGMDFEYEHMGSDGERIQCFNMSLRVVIQYGKIYFTYGADRSELEENEKSMSKVLNLLDSAIIEETN